MYINWIKLFEQYKGKWVALQDDEVTVVGYGASAKEAQEQARKKGCKKPILARMPDTLESYVGIQIQI